MGIDVTCGNCRVSFRVKDEYAGRWGKCPHCRSPVEVPQVVQSDMETLGPVVLPEETVTMRRPESETGEQAEQQGGENR